MLPPKTEPSSPERPLQSELLVSKVAVGTVIVPPGSLPRRVVSVLARAMLKAPPNVGRLYSWPIEAGFEFPEGITGVVSGRAERGRGKSTSASEASSGVLGEQSASAYAARNMTTSFSTARRTRRRGTRSPKYAVSTTPRSGARAIAPDAAITAPRLCQWCEPQYTP